MVISLRVRLSRRFLVAAASSVAFLAAAAPAQVAAATPEQVAAAAHGYEPRAWVGSWGASPLTATSATMQVTHLADQTVRNIVYTSVGGDRVRIRVSNAFGDRTVTIGRASIATEYFGASVKDLHALTFRGRSSVQIPPGAEVLSDSLPLRVPPLTDLAVSLYVPSDTGPVTSHFLARQNNYLATGNHATDVSATAFSTVVTAWYLLDDVLVSGPSRGTVVAFGDSITDGDQSQLNANMRWPNELARRLVQAYGRKAPGVLDEGIAGNRVLNDSACLGVSAQKRLNRDVLSQPGLRWVILMEGINDIGFSAITNPCTTPNPDVSAAQIIAGYRNIIDRVHGAGAKIYGATMTPWKFSPAWTPAGEAKRETINRWIRTSGAFDAVIDFAKVVAEPGDPQLMAPKYDSGDHIHPNDSGYAAMGQAVNLRLFAH
jgi:lysophospholipase L1-like esterase